MPKQQLQHIKPYRHVGIDFSGHLFVKNSSSNCNEKMYILIFTCLNIRAFHIELLPDIEVHNFVLTF